MSHFRKLSIHKQIFIALVAIVVIATMVFAVVMYYFSSKTIRQEYQVAHVNGMQVAGNLLDSNLESVIDEERSYLTNKVFLQNFKEQKEGSRTFAASTSRQLLNQLQKTLFNGTAVRDILAVNTVGNVVFASQNDHNRQFIQHYFSEDDILDEDWVQDCVSARGREVFYPSNILFDENSPTNSDSTFSVAKMLLDSDGNTLGYLVFNVRKSYLSSVFGKTEEGETSDYLILDAGADIGSGLEASIVYSSVPVDTEELKNIVHDFQTDNGRNYVFTVRDSTVNSWEVVNVISRKELTSRSNYILLVAVLMLTVLVVVSIPMSSYIAGTITKPLQTLEGTIQEVQSGKLRVEADFDDSEVGRIGQQFKSLVNNNLDLKDRLLQSEIRERDAELQLLQSQINPHFLYNTLDALYMMAIIHGEDEIADFVQALSENFKLSLNKGAKLIRIEDELNRIRAYMKIQNYRFQNRYQLDIRVEEGLLPEYILTFILQPLVENAVVHGLEPKPGQGTIRITGEAVPEGIRLCVKDDGVGIVDMQVLEKGYGVCNVRERLRLFYRGRARLCFYSGEGEGTTAEIRVPRLTEQEVQKVMEESKLQVMSG